MICINIKKDFNMLKIYIPNISKQILGGGFTFRRNIAKGSVGKFNIVNEWKKCDIILIAGVTITDRKEIEEAKKAGIKIVLRIDNMPKDSRNRGTAFSRMKDFALMADYIIFQSEWARDYVGSWLSEKVIPRAFIANIIYNGVDKDCFYEDCASHYRETSYLVVQHNRDENKRVQEAFYDFFTRFKEDNTIKLNIVGRFSPEVVNYNFDFFNGENVAYYGIIDNPKEMGKIMRENKYFYFPAFADASPNTLVEAISSGCKPLLINDIGGSKEVARNIYSIQKMADKYLSVFNKLMK